MTTQADRAGAAHGAIGRVDLSSSPQRASADPVRAGVSEADLFLGHGPCAACQSYPCRCVAMRRETCVCGVVLVAETNNWQAITAVVSEHNESKPHLAWRHWRRELDTAA